MFQPRNRRTTLLVALAVIFIVSTGACHQQRDSHHEYHATAAQTSAPRHEATKAHIAQPLTVAGLHQVYRLTEKLYSGAEPSGEAAFGALQKLGIRTIISVDGARPDAALAKRFGMRYVHLPFGYDTVSADRANSLIRAVRDLPAPVYIHCHHGKHRGPTGAAFPLLALADWTTDETIAAMKTMGVAAKYSGLYAAVRAFTLPTGAALAAVNDTFPAYHNVQPLTQAMAQLSRRWDQIKAVRRAGWKTPKDNPDLAPAHEALQMRELLHELGREATKRKRPADFRGWLKRGEVAARDMEINLRQPNHPAAAAAYKKLAATCRDCHAKYRGDD